MPRGMSPGPTSAESPNGCAGAASNRSTFFVAPIKAPCSGKGRAGGGCKSTQPICPHTCESWQGCPCQARLAGCRSAQWIPGEAAKRKGPVVFGNAALFGCRLPPTCPGRLADMPRCHLGSQEVAAKRGLWRGGAKHSRVVLATIPPARKHFHISDHVD